MATARTFQDMLNDYLTNPLLKEELVKRDYLLTNIEKKDDWKTGDLIVPFKGAGASSIRFGSLSDENDIAEDKYVRGSVTAPAEVWGTMKFKQRDLIEHDVISEQNFLKLLPETIEDFMDNYKNTVSIALMNGAHIVKVTNIDNAATGSITVDRPERLMIDQKLVFDDDDNSPSDGNSFVKTIIMDTGVITLVTVRGGSVADDLSATLDDLAKDPKAYNEDAKDNSFTSLRDSMLSAANGGSTTLYGQTKTAFPYLQSINVDGGVAGKNVTSASLLQNLFDTVTDIENRGRGRITDIVMSYKNFGAAVKNIENSKGDFNVTPGSRSAMQFGWREIEVGSVTGHLLKLVGVQEMDDDIIMFIDWRALSFHSNGFIRKHKDPDGNEFHKIRATTGYSYLIDIYLFGELVLKRPSFTGILHSISF